MEFEFWWLLAFPLFFVLGWLAARVDIRQVVTESRALPNSYFRGLNFLLNEQPDKAIDAFIDVVRLDPETIELHFALGNLFRRRGETDRAGGEGNPEGAASACEDREDRVEGRNETRLKESGAAEGAGAPSAAPRDGSGSGRQGFGFAGAACDVAPRLSAAVSFAGTGASAGAPSRSTTFARSTPKAALTCSTSWTPCATFAEAGR